jgi:hypothetical protein
MAHKTENKIVSTAISRSSIDPSLPWGKFNLSETAQAAKAEALQCFSSQLFPYKRPPVVPDHAMTYFTRPYEAFLL